MTAGLFWHRILGREAVVAPSESGEAENDDREEEQETGCEASDCEQVHSACNCSVGSRGRIASAWLKVGLEVAAGLFFPDVFRKTESEEKLSAVGGRKKRVAIRATAVSSAITVASLTETLRPV
jgi:hypothetical protein